MNNKTEIQKFIEALEQSLPAVFARYQLTELTGGLINSRTIANRMSRGDGPPGIRIGKNVGFSRGSFIAWLRDNIKNITNEVK